MSEGRRIGQGLEEEEPEHPSRADIEVWTRIYADLTEFTRLMLERTRRFMDSVPQAAQRHLRNTNIQIMEEELEVFTSRLAIWRERDSRTGRTGAQPGPGPGASSSPPQ